jgi:Cd2+/Zn2+-exporting ATPase
VLIKGGARLEQLAAVRCVAFDKTGTLTRGVLHVVDVVPFGERTQSVVLQAAAALESRSEHPIGQAIVRHAAGQQLEIARADQFQAFPGSGAEARVGHQVVLCGNQRLFRDRGLHGPEIEAAVARFGALGAGTVFVAVDNQPIGAIGVADRHRDAARESLDLLRRQGIQTIAMLTGDNAAAANALAASLAIDDVRADLLPADKADAVNDLRRAHGPLAMVGDGVNDAPALATADVGIAMGAAGSAAALETADVALMADDLPKISYAVRLSRATARNIRVNIGFSLVLKAAFLVMAIAGAATLWMAVAADMGASLLVVANALRLLRE